MRKPLLMMRARGLSGPSFAKHAGSRVGYPLSRGGIVLGPEIIIDGDMSNSGAWTFLGPDWIVAGGVATRSGASFSSLRQTDMSLIKDGHKYALMFTCISYTSGSLTAYLGTNQVDTNIAIAPGLIVAEYIADGTSGFMQLSSADWEGSLDDVSLRQIL